MTESERMNAIVRTALVSGLAATAVTSDIKWMIVAACLISVVSFMDNDPGRGKDETDMYTRSTCRRRAKRSEIYYPTKREIPGIPFVDGEPKRFPDFGVFEEDLVERMGPNNELH